MQSGVCAFYMVVTDKMQPSNSVTDANEQVDVIPTRRSLQNYD